MQINSNSIVMGGVKTHQPPPQTARAAAPQQDQATFGTTDSINKALEQTPEVRSEKVEQAKQLIADASYPPPETIRKIAHLLAANFLAD